MVSHGILMYPCESILGCATFASALFTSPSTQCSFYFQAFGIEQHIHFHSLPLPIECWESLNKVIVEGPSQLWCLQPTKHTNQMAAWGGGGGGGGIHWPFPENIGLVI